MSRTLVCIAIAAAAALASPASGATLIESQPPCVRPGTDYCVKFTVSDPVPVIRTISITAPSKGKAVVTFHGSMKCIHVLGFTVRTTFASQIVSNPGVLADDNGPGGLSHTFDLSSSEYFPINLASTRTFLINAAGQHTFYFKLRKLNMQGVCTVHNATFSVVFTST